MQNLFSLVIFTITVLTGLANPVVRPQCRAAVCDDRPTCPKTTCRCVFPSRVDCSVYYQCVDGKPFQYRCSSGLLFNEDTLSCDYDFNVNCTLDVTTTGSSSLTSKLPETTIYPEETTTNGDLTTLQPTISRSTTVEDSNKTVSSGNFTETTSEANQETSSITNSETDSLMSSSISSIKSSDSTSLSTSGDVTSTDAETDSSTNSRSTNAEVSSNDGETVSETSRDLPTDSITDISTTSHKFTSTHGETDPVATSTENDATTKFETSSMKDATGSETTNDDMSTNSETTNTKQATYNDKTTESETTSNIQTTSIRVTNNDVTTSSETTPSKGNTDNDITTTSETTSNIETTRSGVTNDVPINTETTSNIETTKGQPTNNDPTTNSETLVTKETTPSEISTNTTLPNHETSIDHETSTSKSTGKDSSTEPETTYMSTNDNIPISYKTTSAATNATKDQTETVMSSTPMYTETEPQDTSEPTSEITTEDTSSNNFTCPSRFGLFPDPTSCSQFYQCSHFTAYRMECPSDLHFNPSLQVCDWPYRAGCALGDSTSTAVTETTTPPPKTTSTLPPTPEATTTISSNNSCSCDSCDIPIPTECSSYILCIDRNAIPISCEDGLYYNAYFGTCDLMANVRCDAPVRCPENNGRFPYPNSCQHFMDCRHGEMDVRKCPEGMNYDKVAGDCSWDSSCEGETTIAPNKTETTFSSTPTDVSITSSTETDVPTDTSSIDLSTSSTPTDVSVISSTGTDVPTEISVDLSTFSSTPTDVSVISSTATDVPTETSVDLSTFSSTPTDVSVISSTATDVPTETSVDLSTFSSTPTDVSITSSTPTDVPTETSVDLSTFSSTPSDISITSSTPTDVPTETSVDLSTLSSTPTDVSITSSTPTDVPTETSFDLSTFSSTSTDDFPIVSDKFTETPLATSTDTLPPTAISTSKPETTVPTEGDASTSTHADTSTTTSILTKLPTQEDTTITPGFSSSTFTESTTKTPTSTNRTLISSTTFSEESSSIKNEETTASRKSTRYISGSPADDLTTHSFSTESASTIDSQLFKCPTRFGLFPDPNSCFWFYHCSHWIPHHKLCPSNLHFNPTLEVCDWPYRAGCNLTVTTQNESTSTARTPKETTSYDNETSQTVSDALPTTSKPETSSDVMYHFECPSLFGLFPDPESCFYFYQCSHWTAHHTLCPSSLHFNPELMVCDWPYRAGCGSTIPKPTPSHDNIPPQNQTKCDCECCFLPDKTDCSKYQLCLDGVIHNGQCTEGLLFNADTNNCDMADRVDCPLCSGQDEFFGDKADCAYFYRCVDGKLSSAKCPAGQHFREGDGKCVDPCQAGCDQKLDCSSNKENPTPSLICQEGDGLYPVKDDCSSFYQCSNGIPYRVPCPSGLNFNLEYKVCEPPCDAQCDTRIVCSMPKPNPEPNCTCENCLLPDPTDCSAYHICIHNRLTKGYCPPGLLFDGPSSNCKNEAEVECEANADPAMCPVPFGNFAYPGDCGKFVHCEDSVAHVRECESGFEFDTESGTCSAAKGKCGVAGPDPVCRIPTGLFPHPANCSLFYQCENGISFLKACSSPLVYNSEEQVCDWPQNYHCGKDRNQSSINRSGPLKLLQDCYAVPGVTCPCACRVPTYDECSSFYHCQVDGTACKKHCPSGLFFNKKTMMCDLQEHVECRDFFFSEINRMKSQPKI